MCFKHRILATIQNILHMLRSFHFFAFIVIHVLVLLNHNSKYKTYRAYVNYMYVAMFDNIGQYCYEAPSTGVTHKFNLMYSRSASEFANI